MPLGQMRASLAKCFFGSYRLSNTLTGRIAAPLPGSKLRWLREEQGSELIEVAIVLPLYLMLVFGFTSFALVLFAYGNATFAAKAAVRYAVVHSIATMAPCTATTIQGIVTPWLWGAPAGGVTIIPSWPMGNTVGNVVSVTVKLTYSTGMPYVGLSGMVATASAQGVIVH